MAEQGQATPPPQSSGAWGRSLPVLAVWCSALLPLLLYLLHRSDPVLAVEAADALSTWALRMVSAGAAVAALCLLLYPPFPAWIRRFADRTRRSWTVDRQPLTQALNDLQHFETAQRHFEVARLAWLRTDMALVGPHAARAVELDPEMPQAHMLLGRYLARVGALPQALLAFRAADRLDPGHAFGEAQLLQARVLAQLGRLEEALDRFDRFKSEHGGGHRSNFWHGEALARAGRNAEAGDAFREAATDPGQKLPPEEGWFRALARVKCWRYGGKS